MQVILSTTWMQKPARKGGRIVKVECFALAHDGAYATSMDIDAFILIGGKSSRFGSDKAFAELNGQTLAARAAQTVSTALSPRRIRFVAGSENQFASSLLFGLGLPVVADLKPGFGAWSGLHTALAYSSTEWTFVLACDLPFVSAELIEKLAALAADDVDAIVPRQADERLQPLCAFYRRSTVLREVEERFTGLKKLPEITELFSMLRTRIIEIEEYCDLPGSREFFVNVNYMGDLSL